MKSFFLLVTLAALVLGAKAQDIVRDAQALKRDVAAFHGIEVSGGIDLYVSQGDPAVAVSAADSRVRDRIRTEVRDGVLHIWYEYAAGLHLDFHNLRRKAYVSARNLDQLRASGGSDVYVKGSMDLAVMELGLSGGSDFDGQLRADVLHIRATGGSDVRISGAAGKLTLEVSGGSDFHGYGLVTDQGSLEASGGSDVYITVNKELAVHASGGSDVQYKGSGQIREIRSGGSSSVRHVSR